MDKNGGPEGSFAGGMEVAQAVPYKVEGGKGIPHEVGADEVVVNELFDLSYTDYHFYKEKFLEKGLPLLPLCPPLTIHTCFPM